MKITDYLYFYPWLDMRANNGNTLFIDGPAKVIIDPGHNQFFDVAGGHMKADGLDPDRATMVIATHGHPDHIDDTSRFSPDTKIAMHADDDEFIRTVGPAFHRAMGLPEPNIRVDVHLAEGELIIGDITWNVIHTSGHSPGSVCLFNPADGVLITGDVIFEMGVGRTDFPGGDGNLLKKSILRLKDLGAEIVLPGHGNPVQGKKNVAKNFEYIEQVYFAYI